MNTAGLKGASAPLSPNNASATETNRNVAFNDKKSLSNDNGVAASRATSNAHQLHREASADTMTEKEHSLQEIRPVPHHYFFERPRALQYTYLGERISYGEDAAPISHEISSASDLKYTAEGVAKARERIDLFIDLVWVGIISNLSEVFSEVYFAPHQSAGKAFLMFIVVFLPAWRIWNFLREFLNSYYMDDTGQRAFIFWILTLSIFFGNQVAYFASDYEGVKVALVSTYIIVRASFVFMEIFYSFWIPWIRKLIFVHFLVMLPASGLWMGTIFTDGPAALGPALAAIGWEYFVPWILESPIGAKLHSHDYRKDVDPTHLKARMGSFLIITVGEGVLMLVRGGPTGQGFTAVTALAAWSLLLYFLLAYLYFYRDGSIRYIPAVRRGGWRRLIWITMHIPIFAAFITLSSGVLWFIRDYSHTVEEGTEEAHLTEEEVLVNSYRAFWNIGVSISIILSGYTGLALLDKSLDSPKATLVSNIYVRLLARPIYIAVILAVVTAHDINAYWYFGVCGVGMSLTLLYEVVASMERPAGLFEPRGLTVLMKKEYRRGGDNASADGVRIAI